MIDFRSRPPVLILAILGASLAASPAAVAASNGVATSATSESPSPTPNDSAAAILPVLRIDTPTPLAPEGSKPGVFRIRRDRSGPELNVSLAIAGEAEPGRDYTIANLTEGEAAGPSLILAAGQDSIDLEVQALDDVAAEADEEVRLTLRGSPSYGIDPSAPGAAVTIPRNDFVVNTTRDGGEGSLRQAIRNAIDLKGPNTVTFDSKDGPFAEPQTIELQKELPILTGEVRIDGNIEGRLWQATGVTVSGANRFPVFRVAPGARVELLSLTVADGKTRRGAGIANAGRLVVKGVTIRDNHAGRDGGGIANLEGTLTVINSTFVNNYARRGGGLFDKAGTVTVTHCTFSVNQAKRGGALFSSGRLLVRNSILANSAPGRDCVLTGSLDPASTHNLIEANDGCGEPISTADPALVDLGNYNGPVPTMPLGGASPAVNLADNASALDENGEPLRWDQRGNGDPRSVAGFADLGAFETQAWPTLRVDTFEDSELRACTGVAAGNCSLRGALMLANATPAPDVITFDARVFAEPRTITLRVPLPVIAAPVTIDGSAAAGLTVRAEGSFQVFQVLPGTDLTLTKVVPEDGTPAAASTK